MSEELYEVISRKCGELRDRLLGALATGDYTRALVLYLIYREFCSNG